MSPTITPMVAAVISDQLVFFRCVSKKVPIRPSIRKKTGESIKPSEANKTTDSTVRKIFPGNHSGSHDFPAMNQSSGRRGKRSWATWAPIMPPKRRTSPEKIILTIFPKPSVIVSPLLQPVVPLPRREGAIKSRGAPFQTEGKSHSFLFTDTRDSREARRVVLSAYSMLPPTGRP